MLGIGADRNLPTVLLIDDDLISREVIATVLTLNGYTLHTAEDGATGVKLLDSQAVAPHIVLVDARMDGLSGLPLIAKLRAFTPARIYAISGSPLSADLRAAVDGFLLKPFGLDAFQKIVEQDTVVAAPDSKMAGEPVISAEILSQFRQMMPENTVREVYKAVLADLQKHIQELDGAISRRDAAEVRRIGHTIKGGCGMAGARQAATLGAMFESESDEMNNSAAIQLELKAALTNLERMLKVEFPP
jgi:CheY-like chemotaxis protein